MAFGFEEIVISAFSVDRIATPLVEVGGYRRIELPDAPFEQYAAWHVPEGCTRIEQCLLTPPNDLRGHLRVVVFHGVEKKMMRPSQAIWDSGGIFDVDVYTRDARGTYRALQQQGWTAFGEPVDYVLGDFDVCEVIAIGPDGLIFALIEPHNPPLIELPEFHAMSRIFNSTQTVRDFGASLDFYRNILGWKILMQSHDSGNDDVGRMIGLPMPVCAEVERHLAIVHPEGGNDGSVELIEIADVRGHDNADNAVAPNVGLLTLRFPVEDARGEAAAIRSRGGRLYTEPMALQIAPYGPVELFSIRTPDGAILEFFQRL